MKRQRGQAIILVLILMAVGSMMIVPTLSYTTTALHSQTISEERVAKQYGTDAAVEDALYQMLDGLLDTLDPDTSLDSHHWLGDYRGVRSLDDPRTVVVEVIMGHENDIGGGLRRAYADGLAIMRIRDDDRASRYLETRMTMPSDAQGSTSLPLCVPPVLNTGGGGRLRPHPLERLTQ